MSVESKSFSDLSSEPKKKVGAVRMGIIGANFGAIIARNLRVENEFIRLQAVCDADKVKADALSTQTDVRAYYDLDALLADPSVEAVGLFTAASGRASLIRKILRTGRHVMTTKPFEIDIEAAKSVLDEARELGLAVHLNSPAPVPADDIKQIHAWVKEHSLGRPIAMRAETWANYHEVANGSWYDDPLQCPAAPIFRLGIYLLNDFAPLLGTPRTVHVMATRIRTGRPTADNAQLCIEFENGALGNVFASFCVNDGQPWCDRVTLNYENGTIHRWMERCADAADMSGDRATVSLDHATAKVAPVQMQPGAYAGWYDWVAFHDAIRGIHGAPLQDADKILFGVRLLNAMRRSTQSGLPESVG